MEFIRKFVNTNKFGLIKYGNVYDENDEIK